MGNVLDLNTSLILLGKWSLFGRYYLLVFCSFLSNCRLSMFQSEVKIIVRTASFLITS